MSLTAKIEKALRNNPYGLTLEEISEVTEDSFDRIHRAILAISQNVAIAEEEDEDGKAYFLVDARQQYLDSLPCEAWKKWTGM